MRSNTLSGNRIIDEDIKNILSADFELTSFEHKGSWQNCDTKRDLDELERLAVQINFLMKD